MCEMLVNFVLNTRVELSSPKTDEAHMDVKIAKKTELADKKDRRLFLKRWIDKHTVGEDSFTALHFAAFRGNIPILRLLLKYDANLNCANVNGVNLLHVCA